MSIHDAIATIAESALFIAGLFLLAGSILITFKTRFVQVRVLSSIIRILLESLWKSSDKGNKNTIAPYKALFMAMSTTAGIGTIVAPVIAIHFGGPGALLGFLITSFLGSAATYTEVSLCIQHKTKREDDSIIGGPMSYLSHLFSGAVAKWYATCCLILMMSWSGAQANQLAAIFDSTLVHGFRVSKALCGFVIAIFVVFCLLGGVKRISNLATKVLLPAHFVFYVSACLWIICSHFDQLGGVICEMFRSILHPYQMTSGALVGGIVSSTRWGVFKGIHACEGGIGTQTFPHSMAETKDAIGQGMLAMLSTYAAGFIALLSGLVALLTRTWESSDLPLGMCMVASSFQMYFSTYGIAILGASVLLFGFGTILGNSYNGTQCFSFLTGNKGARCYFLATAGVIFLGAISDVKLFWSCTDVLLAAMAVPHMSALVYYTFMKQKDVAPELITI